MRIKMILPALEEATSPNFRAVKYSLFPPLGIATLAGYLDDFDTRHAVFEPKGMSAEQLEQGYWRAYEQFYSWRNIAHSASTKDGLLAKARHLAYSGGWKKFEPLWDWVVRHQHLPGMRPILERTLAG